MEPDSGPNDLRFVAQELESLRRAGVTWVPKLDASILAPAAAPKAAAPASPSGSGLRPLTPLRPSPSASTPAPLSPMPKRAGPGAKLDGPPATPAPATTPAAAAASAELTVIPPQPLDLGQRRELLSMLCGKVAACVRCEELARTRTRTVFGVGNPEAKILFIGEAPGADEDKQGEPFVGRAGQLLTKIIGACQLTREEVFICNVLRCRPPGNRTPSPTESGNCWEWLSSTLAVVDPEYIVCLGSVAAQTLMKTTQSIGKMRGRFLSYGRAKVLCTYHPSYLLRNPDAKKDVWEDMKFLMRDMGVVL